MMGIHDMREIWLRDVLFIIAKHVRLPREVDIMNQGMSD